MTSLAFVTEFLTLLTEVLWMYVWLLQLHNKQVSGRGHSSLLVRVKKPMTRCSANPVVDVTGVY